MNESHPNEYTITFTDKPTAEDVGVLSQGLHRFGEAIFGSTWARSIAFYLRDAEGRIVGGVYGNYGSYNWLYVDTLWVSDEVRGRGYGAQLLTAIENEAVKHNCTNIYLDTFSFQAPKFYKKLGYEVFGKLDDFPEGHSRIFLRKKLS
jgi:GNAT superfamily N-acetyltransferase